MKNSKIWKTVFVVNPLCEARVSEEKIILFVESKVWRISVAEPKQKKLKNNETDTLNSETISLNCHRSVCWIEYYSSFPKKYEIHQEIKTIFSSFLSANNLSLTREFYAFYYTSWYYFFCFLSKLSTYPSTLCVRVCSDIPLYAYKVIYIFMYCCKK